MKLIHTSDWHIGQEIFGYDRSEEHRDFFEQLCEIVKTEKPDALLVSGDIYHNAMPSSAATKLYTEEMVKLHESCPTMQIYVTAGNHDSYNRLEATSDVWKLAKVTVVGNIPRNLQTREAEYNKMVFDAGSGYVIAIPYFNGDCAEMCRGAQEYVKEINKEDKPVIMMAHTTVSNAEYTGHKVDQRQGKDSVRLAVIGGVDAENITQMGEYYDYLALGHIHCPQTLKYERTARYSGSTVQVNFDENYPHTVTIVEIAKHDEKPQLREIEIKQSMKFYTIPKVAEEFEQALSALASFNPTEPGYVRLNVKVKDYIPTDGQVRAEKAIENNANLKFCYINTVKEKSDKTTEHKSLNTQEIKDIDPLELALQYYREQNNSELDVTLLDMLKDILEEIKA